MRSEGKERITVIVYIQSEVHTGHEHFLVVIMLHILFYQYFFNLFIKIENIIKKFIIIHVLVQLT